MHALVRSPTKATKFDEVIAHLDVWENNLRKYIDAGGKRLDDEVMVIIAFDILPGDLPFTFVSGLRRMQSYDDLRERLREETDYFAAGAHRLNTGKGLLAVEAAGGDKPEGEPGGDGDEIVAAGERAGPDGGPERSLEGS